MRQFKFIVVVALTVITLATVADRQIAFGQEFVGPVGAWGDPARIRIVGARQIEPEHVKHELVGHFQHFMASHPSAPLKNLSNSIQEQVLLGYQHAGFGEARVQVRLDFETQQVIVKIDEGQRWTAGAIRVEGSPQIQSRLKAQLAVRRAPDGATPATLNDYGGVIEWADANGKKVEEEKPLWIQGLPVQFDRMAIEKRRKRIQQALADLGFDSAQFESTVTTDGPAAEWHVRVGELGAPAVIRTIETTGNQKNTREEIIDYLNLQPGTIVTREFRQRITRSLWNSARFTKTNVAVERTPGDDGVILKIDVQEYEAASRLADSLSREEAALAKLRHWMIHGAGSQADIVVTASRANDFLEVILSPVEGISSCWWKSNVASGPPEHAILATDEQVAAYALPDKRVLALPVTGVQLNANLTLTTNEGDPEHPFKIQFGFGFESLEDDETRSPLTLTTSLPPVFFLAAVHEKAECSWDGPVLTVHSKRSTTRINEKTGELVDHRSNPSEADGLAFGFSFQPKAFSQRHQQIIAATADGPNDFERERPVSSAAAFFLKTGMLSKVGSFLYGEPFQQHAPQESLAVLGKLIDNGALAIVDSAVTAMFEDGGDEFDIPWQPEANLKFQAKHLYGFLVAKAADEVFPRDSWAWTMWRESALVVAGLGQFAGLEVRKILSDENCGPSTYWLLAELLKSVNQPVEQIARRGLNSFDRLEFIHEWESALGRDLHPAVVATLTALRSLSDEEMFKLMALVDGGQNGWGRIAQQLRNAVEQSADDSTAELLSSIWSTELRDRLEKRLHQLADPQRVAEKPGERKLK